MAPQGEARCDNLPNSRKKILKFKSCTLAHHCMNCVRWSDCWFWRVLQTLPGTASGSLREKSPLTACLGVLYISKCKT